MSEAEVLENKQKEAEEERKLLAAYELGQAVKARLKELRWVQQDLADELHTSQSAISNIIAGRYLLTFDLVTRVSKALKMSPMELAGYYWKEQEQELKEQNREIIERVRELLTEYYQIGGHQQDKEPEQLPPHTDRYTSPELEAKTPQSDQLAREESLRRQQEKEKDQPEPPEPTDQGKDTTTENISQEPHTEKED